MENGIRPKHVTKGSKQFDEHAKRYIFFPLHNLDFAWSQGTSPIWQPKIPKGRFVLLESFEYMTQMPSENEFSGGGVVLGQRTMGTDAQVSYLMGSSSGVGYLEQGMTFLQPLTDVEPSLAVQIEKMILPVVNDVIEVPRDLTDFKAYLSTVSIEGDNPVAVTARETLALVKDGVDRAITYCMVTSNSLEKELAEGKAGRMGIKSLNATQRYFFEQIRRPLPEDRIGQNMGDQILRALQPLTGAAQATPPSTFQTDMELELLQNRLKELETENKQLSDTVVQQGEVIQAYEETPAK